MKTKGRTHFWLTSGTIVAGISALVTGCAGIWGIDDVPRPGDAGDTIDTDLLDGAADADGAEQDGGLDASDAAKGDAQVDAGSHDASVDATADARTDAGTDAGPDAKADAGSEAGPEGGSGTDGTCQTGDSCVCDDHSQPTLYSGGPAIGPGGSPPFYSCGSSTDCESGYLCVDEGFCKPVCTPSSVCAPYMGDVLACQAIVEP